MKQNEEKFSFKTHEHRMNSCFLVGNVIEEFFQQNSFID
jgi:hypothetical protein